MNELIAEVLRKHAGFANGGLTDCDCGIKCFTFTEYHAHVAEMVAEALGLTEERRGVNWLEWQRGVRIGERRFVTRWETQQ